jgi:hypothetical protein
MYGRVNHMTSDEA